MSSSTYHWVTRRAAHLVFWGIMLSGFYFIFAVPAKPYWEGSVPELFQNPLGMMLSFILLVTMMVYIIHHAVAPDKPRHRSWFVFSALVAGLVADGLYERALGTTPDYFNTSGGAQFIAVAVISYCVYRIVECLPPKPREWATLAFAFLLAGFIATEAYQVSQITSACTAENFRTVWGQILLNCG